MSEGTKITDVLSSDDLKVWQERYDKGLAGERQHFTEERVTGDKILYLEVFVESIFDDHQEVIGCAVVSRDVTDQKSALDKAAMLEAELAVKKVRL